MLMATIICTTGCAQKVGKCNFSEFYFIVMLYSIPGLENRKLTTVGESLR
jgi:hypothetical protein